MTTRLILFLAALLEWIGRPPLDSDDRPVKRLRIARTSPRPHPISMNDWYEYTKASRLDRAQPDYWKIIKEGYIRTS
jgi:hypothetical protein